MINYCEACGIRCVVDRAHIQSKGSGGSFEDNNVILLCRRHHQQSHQIGWNRFLLIFPHIEKIFNSKGWAITDVFGVKKLRNMYQKKEEAK